MLNVAVNDSTVHKLSFDVDAMNWAYRTYLKRFRKHDSERHLESFILLISSYIGSQEQGLAVSCSRAELLGSREHVESTYSISPCT